jgi:NitT/TauT family transport system ATP-binding protein
VFGAGAGLNFMPGAEPTKIEFRDLRKAFRRGGAMVDVLGPLSLQVRRGEFLALLGPSGCGKSTTLNMTAGLMRPSAGAVLFDGVPVTKVNTRVGYLTQRDTLLPWRSVAGNVAVPLEIQGCPAAERKARVRDALASVGLAEFAEQRPAELSGGMRRRVALARMLVSAPDTLLMDEPFGALDAQLKMVMHQQLLDVWQAERKTVLFVTHDLAEALILADRVVVLGARPGRVKAVFDVALGRPRDVFALQFEPSFVAMEKRLWDVMREDILEGEAA